MLDHNLRLKLDRVAYRQRTLSIMTSIADALGVAFALYIAIRVLGLWLALPAGLNVWLPIVVGLIVLYYQWDPPASRLAAAQLIDDELNLKDRLGTAVEFASIGETTSPVIQKLHADVAKYTGQIDPKHIVPYSLPRRTFWLIPLIALVIAVNFSPLSTLRTGVGQNDMLTEDQSLLHEQTQTLEELAEHLRNEGLEADNPHLLQLGDAVSQLIAQLRDGTITEDDFFSELARLEDQLNAALDDPNLGQRESGAGKSGETGRQDPSADQNGHAGGEPEDASDTTDRDEGDPSAQDGTDEDRDTNNREESPPGGSDDAEGEIDPDGSDLPDTGGDDPGTDGIDEIGSGPQDAEAPGDQDSAGFDGDPSDTPPAGDEDRPDVDGERQRLHGTMSDSDGVLSELQSLATPGDPGEHISTATDFDGELSGGTEESVDRESVPPAYRYWVQRYFEQLAN